MGLDLTWHKLKPNSFPSQKETEDIFLLYPTLPFTKMFAETFTIMKMKVKKKLIFGFEHFILKHLESKQNINLYLQEFHFL